MSALNFLSLLLQPIAQVGAREMRVSDNINDVLRDMEARSKAGGKKHLSEDHQLEAVGRFWDSHELKTFRDVYLVSWGLCLPHRPKGSCVLDDYLRFQLLLDGVDRWKSEPCRYRRCYQGLVKSYFIYDALVETSPVMARKNWHRLRDYLRERNRFIHDEKANPDWVATAIENVQLFEDRPCEPYVERLLYGDSSAVEQICAQLGISNASWFQRELILAQIRAATKLSNVQFVELMPRLLELLTSNEVLRDRGLILILDRYVKIPVSAAHKLLRDSSVLWWGNPWLPSNENRWGGVVREARDMVADWLKLEFIETFFTKLAEDGLGDRRRMDFWKQYVKSIDQIEFALGSNARNSRESDFVALRKKMTGLICVLEASGTNNAFIMTMGNLVAVEFSGMGNALYGYDARKALPFDTTEPLRLGVDAYNSLKQRSDRILWLSHQDGIHNSDKWEHMFAARLRENFGIQSGTAALSAVPAQTPKSAPEAENTNMAWKGAAAVTPLTHSRSALNTFATAQGLKVEDKTTQGGSLWVLVGAEDDYITRILTLWGFNHKPGKGWWK